MWIGFFFWFVVCWVGCGGDCCGGVASAGENAVEVRQIRMKAMMMVFPLMVLTPSDLGCEKYCLYYLNIVS